VFHGRKATHCPFRLKTGRIYPKGVARSAACAGGFTESNIVRGVAAQAHHLRRIGVTTGGISTLGLELLFASNCAGLRNITLH
jgi:hypothetical protein